MEFILKAVLGGILIATVSTLAQKNTTWAALLMGLPITAITAMIFMYYSGVEDSEFIKFSYETVVFVGISLTMFVIFAMMITYIGFWWSLISGMATTVVIYNIILQLMN